MQDIVAALMISLPANDVNQMMDDRELIENVLEAVAAQLRQRFPTAQIETGARTEPGHGGQRWKWSTVAKQLFG